MPRACYILVFFSHLTVKYLSRCNNYAQYPPLRHVELLNWIKSVPRISIIELGLHTKHSIKSNKIRSFFGQLDSFVKDLVLRTVHSIELDSKDFNWITLN